MKYAQALFIAERVARDVSPLVERIEIAGSLRRKKPEVHDIELVVVPKFRYVPGLFSGVNFPDEPAPKINLFNECIHDAFPFLFSKDGDRMKQITLPEGINLEFYIVLPPAQWGVIFAIRTGCADFSRWMVTARRYGGACPSFLKVHDGGLYDGAKLLETPEEKDFFNELMITWIDPEARIGPRADAILTEAQQRRCRQLSAAPEQTGGKTNERKYR